MNRSRFVLALLATLALAAALRFVWPTADPPVEGNVGIVWHDEGAWTHNARNRVLWGTWRTDNWNPVFVAPVFTALEYASFSAFGVGTWQARVVPAVSGLAAVVFLVMGLAAVAGRRAALVGGVLLATNYGFVMWNRAALMESTMTAAMVAAWCAYALGERRPQWGVLAGAAATMAWFTKASAAFFVAALAIDAVVAIMRNHIGPPRNDGRRSEATLGWHVLIGLSVAFAVIGVAFVLPHWTEYRFYNWEMSVTRKPEYSVRALVDRASWMPFVQSLFGRMSLELAAAGIAMATVTASWRSARPAERVLWLWVVLGLAELVVHDSGNERRYVMFIPALVALASVWVHRVVSPTITQIPPQSDAAPARIAMVAPTAVGAVMLFLVAGGLVRFVWLDQALAGQLRWPVRVTGVVVVAALTWVAYRRHRLAEWLVRPRVSAPVVWLAVGLAVASHLWQFAGWAQRRGYYNIDAAIALGRVLPPATVVQGKLANGLMLESRIRPLFIGNGFGNFADRFDRPDARYILTYDLPGIGYESSYGSGLIDGLLERYPTRRIVHTFVVDETTAPDRAVLIDKFPETQPTHARD